MSEALPVLIAGAGYVGSALAARLAEEGREVWALRRHGADGPSGVRHIVGDAAAGQLGPLAGREVDACFLIAPGQHDREGYRRAYLEALEGLGRAVRLRRLLLATSTAVYGDMDGGWVDEATPCEPDSFSGEVLLEAERRGAELAGRSIALRLGGIYGPSRDRLARRIAEGIGIAPRGQTRFSNRIHRDDAAAALVHVLALADPAPVYLGVDDDPSDLHTVERWLCERLGRDPASLEPPPVARRRGNKRASNARLRASGLAFSYPTFREGYEALLVGLR